MAKMGRPAAPPLARPLAEIASHGEKVEKAATGLLRAIRDADLRSLGAFDDAIALAYEANGWNLRPGRPAKDRRAVPHTVRTYVWEIRSAYRGGFEVWTFKSMYELRMAKKAKKEADAVETTGETEGQEIEAHVTPEAVAQDLLGVRVLNPSQFTGALFHDLIVTFMGLGDEQRALFGRQLARLLHKYMAGVSPAGERATPEAANNGGNGRKRRKSAKAA